MTQNNVDTIVTCTTETLLNTYEVNENFLCPGHFHEMGMMGTHPQTGQQGISYTIVYVESVEIIGNCVFLGLRDFYDFKQNDDKTEIISYKLLDTVYYRNLNAFIDIQRFENKARYTLECQAINDMKVKEEQELKTKKEQENDRHDDTPAPASGPGSGFDNASAGNGAPIEEKCSDCAGGSN